MIQLYLGLWAYGASLACLVRAGLGLDPWDIFHAGVAGRVDRSIGTVAIATGAVVLLGWIPLRQRPGLGTISNVVMIGLSLDATLRLLPEVASTAGRLALLSLGVVANGAATAAYIGARLGPGPRDGLMTGIVARTGWSVRLVRTAIEVSVLVAGVALGGPLGLGTVVYALAIGPLVQFFLPRFTAPEPARPADPVASVT